MKYSKLIGEQNLKGDDTTIPELGKLINLFPSEKQNISWSRKVDMTIALYEVRQILAKNNMIIEHNNKGGYEVIDTTKDVSCNIMLGIDKTTGHFFNIGIV